MTHELSFLGHGFPRVDKLDVEFLEVGGVAGGKGEVVDFGGRGDEGVIRAQIINREGID